MNVQHERNRALRDLLRREKRLTPALAAELEQPWRSSGVIVQTVFFVLTCISLGAFHALLDLLDVPREGIAVGVVALLLAEALIHFRRWYGTGVEQALWLGGLLALIFELPSRQTPESILVLAAAGAVAGARVRNPLFGAITVALLAYYAEERFDLGVVVALLLAMAALLALLRTWRRPSTEWLFIAVALLLPAAGYLYTDEVWRTVTIALYTAYAAVALLFGVTRRHHAFFLSAMIALAFAGGDLMELLPYPFEAMLAIAGVLLLAIGFAVSHALRDRTRGFVLTAAELTPADRELELAATFAMKPEGPQTEPPKSGGGSFGGAGASGEF